MVVIAAVPVLAETTGLTVVAMKVVRKCPSPGYYHFCDANQVLFASLSHRLPICKMAVNTSNSHALAPIQSDVVAEALPAHSRLREREILSPSASACF